MKNKWNPKLPEMMEDTYKSGIFRAEYSRYLWDVDTLIRCEIWSLEDKVYAVLQCTYNARIHNNTDEFYMYALYEGYTYIDYCAMAVKLLNNFSNIYRYNPICPEINLYLWYTERMHSFLHSLASVQYLTWKGYYAYSKGLCIHNNKHEYKPNKIREYAKTKS